MSVEIKNLSQAQAKNARESRELFQARQAGGVGPQASKAQAPANSAGDTVTLTKTAKRLNDIQQKISAQPVVDAEKVERLRQSIAAGTYKIDVEKIAERLMNEEI
ncbi:flagellar biosynthesis anti-sigma factor FlgM [Thiorhodospira sibirica]|uniref:flagellar biosynthesis anti-sigma factor FlgM n=1 Tax=Thiorhodospira sibirica TaxID=154347 RepID=UPI00022C58BC|nr:flagellar biosynthesis anti-sigma factor FlgM [Thiorhodospira sibirica]